MISDRVVLSVSELLLGSEDSRFRGSLTHLTATVLGVATFVAYAVDFFVVSSSSQEMQHSSVSSSQQLSATIAVA